MTSMHGLKNLFSDWKSQLSWGRVSSAVALTVAVVQELRGAIEPVRLSIWLGVATGAYGLSKLTEPKGGIRESDQGGPG